MQQQGLFPSALAVVDDYGRIGKGASEAHYVLAENGNEYIIKGPAYTPDHPTVAGNEWVAARLASALGLPVLDHQIVTMGGELFFASSWMDQPTFYPAITGPLLQQCENRERVYDVVVLDALLVNPDRHDENLVVRRVARSSTRHLLVLNDHSHLLVSPCGPTTTGDLIGCLDAPPGDFVRLPFIRDSIVDTAQLDQALDRVEALSDVDLRSIVATTPDGLLPAAEQEVYADFLVQRRSRLRSLFRQHAGEFPNLPGAP